jgi:hypothetical protein
LCITPLLLECALVGLPLGKIAAHLPCEYRKLFVKQ